MGKYEPLERFLRETRGAEVPITFGEIERIIGGKLPPVAHAHRAWWSNNPSNNVMTKSWLAAGFQTERVDMGGEKLVFRRVSAASTSEPGVAEAPGAAAPRPGLVERLRARLGGTVKVAPGVDLTQPTGEVWDAER
jgi:hypothetical protein